MQTTNKPRLRVYPLDPRALTQEQIAVTFAMTSRNPSPFDEIAQAVSEAKAADFHEKWVLNYGHASVAEHAVLHMAVEDISRLACDELEDNRLASYTEKSSRYQLLEHGAYHVPTELKGHPLEEQYVSTCDQLFTVYHRFVDKTMAWLGHQEPQRPGEREGAYRLRLRRVATDHCRFVLPAGTLTNVGVTMNARTLEHAVTKLLSSELAECVSVGGLLKVEGQSITPTLVKYANWNEYLAKTREAQQSAGKAQAIGSGRDGGQASIAASLVHYDELAEQKLVAALLYRTAGRSYEEVWRDAASATDLEREAVVDMALSRMGVHDSPIRELEAIDYTFDLCMDYGAFREYRRHRMQSAIAQPLTVRHGYIVPFVVRDAGLGAEFEEAMQLAATVYARLHDEVSPVIAQYIVTHAHLVRVFAKMNLRECYHLFKLRGAPQAHFTIQDLAKQMMAVVRQVHPLLLKHLQLRD